MCNKRIWLALAMGAAITTFAESGLAEVSLHISSRTSRVVKGEEVWLTFEMQWARNVRLPMLPCGADPDIWTEAVLPDGSSREWMNGQAPLPLPKRPPVDWKQGEPLKGELTVLPLCEPGEYRIRLHYRLHPDWPDRPQYWGGRIASNWVAITIEEPQGEDLRVWQDFPSSIPKPDCQTFRNWYLSHSTTLLTRFPTSTYAGYVLRAPPASFGCSTYDCFDYPEEMLQKECDRGGGDKPTQECMRKERERMEGYAKIAVPFLEAHPDFFDAPRIRRYLAYCLAFTGRAPEAMTHLRILAEGAGAEALEAKAYLEKRAASKCRG